MNKKKLIILISIITVLAVLLGAGLFAVSKIKESRIADKLDMGEKYLEELEYEKALVVYEEILEIDPKNVDAYLGMAEVYIAMGDYEEALEYVEEGYEETESRILKRQIREIEELLEGGENNSEIATAERVDEIPLEKGEEKVEIVVSYEYIAPEVDGVGGNTKAIIEGLGEDGEQKWKYETPEYYEGDLGPIFQEIGIQNGMYYFVENGMLLGFDIVTGDVLWRNEDVTYGITWVFDEEGNMYCTCYWEGADLVIVDKKGNTIQKIKKLVEGYYMPINIQLLRDYVFITYSYADEQMYGEDAGVFYYHLTDGVIGQGYNVAEPEPQYCGEYYGSSYGDVLEINYRGNDTYQVDLVWLQLLTIEKGNAYAKDGMLFFEGEDTSGDVHKGTIEKVGDSLCVTITDTTMFYGVGDTMTFYTRTVDENIFDMIPNYFSFYSGVGAWESWIELSSDGSFEGGYYDWNMGETGENYPGGTLYSGDCNGAFENVKIVEDNIYSVQLAYLNINNTFGEITYEDGYRYVSASPYGIANGEEFLIFLPGASFEKYSDLYLEWWRIGGETDILPEGYYVIYNVNEGVGFIGEE